MNLHCRLRNGLNVDCLAEIFEYLENDDLVTIGQLDEYYQGIINKCVIKKRMIRFEDPKRLYWDVTALLGNDFQHGWKAFEMYGKNITRASFCLRSFYSEDTHSRIIENINKYCSPEKIKEIEFFLRTDCVWCRRNGDCNHKSRVISCVLDAMPALKKLTLIHASDWNNNWLNSTGMLNLTELILMNSHIDKQSMIEYLRKRPKLQRFVNANSIAPDSLLEIGNALAEYCGDTLREFVDTEKEFFWHIPVQDVERYDFIPNLKNVKELELTTIFTCGSDLFYALDGLAKHNKLEKLKIRQHWYSRDYQKVDGQTFILKNDFKILHTFEYEMKSFQMLEFFINNREQIFNNIRTFIPSRKPGNFGPCEFSPFVPKLKKLVISFCSTFDIGNILRNIKRILEKRKDTRVDTEDSIKLRLMESYNLFDFIYHLSCENLSHDIRQMADGFLLTISLNSPSAPSIMDQYNEFVKTHIQQ